MIPGAILLKAPSLQLNEVLPWPLPKFLTPISKLKC
jgi:hypothetical protein